MTRNETHVHDISTLANFKDWAMSFGAAFAAFGWTKSSDTGQVDWSSIASVPASGSTVYEIWKPGDGLTPFYVKMEYGNASNNPAILVQSGTGTNGSGSLTGLTVTKSTPATIGGNGASLYNCLFCGDSSSIAIMFWRDHSGGNVAIGFDRSRDTSGAVTNSYFTQFCTRDLAVTSGVQCYTQQTIMFGVGVAPKMGGSQFGNSTRAHFATILGGETYGNGAVQSMLFNGNYPLCPVFPLVGFYDNPTLCFAHAPTVDFTEMAVITVNMYGVPHNFLFSEAAGFTGSGNNIGLGLGLCMRWE